MGDKTCNDCEFYRPLHGICIKLDEDRHFLDDICSEFEEQNDFI